MMFRNKAALCAALLLVCGAAPESYAPTPQLQGRAAVFAYAAQLKRAWAQQHPGLSSSAMTNPKILSGSVTTPTVNVQAAPPPSPGVQFKFKTDESGLSYVYFDFTNGAGGMISVYFSAGNFPRSGDYTVANSLLGLFTPSGTYTLVSAGIVSSDGNSTGYDAQQAAALVSPSSFTVSNANPGDTTPPTALSGKILTPTISLSSARPLFEANMVVTDDASGVTSAQIQIQDPAGDLFIGSGSASMPITTKSILHVGANLTTGAFGAAPQTGIWTISNILMSDRAGNVVFLSPIQVFGSDTFKVTK